MRHIRRTCAAMGLMALASGCHPSGSGKSLFVPPAAPTLATPTTAAAPITSPAPSEGRAGRRPREFVYVMAGAGTIHQYGVNSDGTLRPLTPPTVDGRHPLGLVVHPSQRFLYAAPDHDTVGTIQPFRVRQDGQLVPLASAHLPGDDLTMDPKGRYPYASGENGAVYVYPIAKDGSLTLRRPTHVFGTFRIVRDQDGAELVGATDTGGLATEPAGRFVYAFHETGFVDHGETSSAVYKIMPGGALRRVGSPHYCNEENPAEDVGLPLFNPTRQIAYINGGRGVVQGIEKADGTIAVLPGLRRVVAGAWLSAIHPSGRYAYFAGPDKILLSDIDSRGIIAAVWRQQVGTVRDASGMEIDPTGRFLYRISEEYRGAYPTGKSVVSQYGIAKDGRLFPLSPATVPLNRAPSALAVVQQRPLNQRRRGR